MSELPSKIRIKDIAMLAGVSEGTVDRVLHGRGDVSAKSRKAVTKVLEEMNYTPNLFARSLASRKQYRFVCLFPTPQAGNYWSEIETGFDRAAIDFVHHNVLVEKRYFNQYDPQSFAEASNAVLSQKPDAVFIAPIFREETLVFTAALSHHQIPFSLIDSCIDEADFVTYYGQDSFKSGYIAAKLLLAPLSAGSAILVAKTLRKGSVSNQTDIRYKGFMQYILENTQNEPPELIVVELNNDDEPANLDVLRNVFATHTNISAAITFNSKVYRLAMHLEMLRQTRVRLIGYDLLAQNVTYLKEGMIEFLIGQRPDKQAYFSIRDMCRELIFRQEIQQIHYVPIDILVKENIEDYRRFQ